MIYIKYFNKKLSVAPLTTHIELKNVPKSLKNGEFKKKNSNLK